MRVRSAIDDYVAALDQRLVGPGRVRTELLREVRDSLDDAAGAYQRGGLTRDSAQRRAVAEFGDAAALARDFQAELGAAAARRLALRLVLLPTLLTLAAEVMWSRAPWTGPAPSSRYLWLSSLVDGLWYGISAGAVLLAVGLAVAARRGRSPRRWQLRATGYATLAALAVATLAGAALSAMSVSQWPAAASWPPMLAGGVVVIAVIGWLAAGAAHCLRAAR